MVFFLLVAQAASGQLSRYESVNLPVIYLNVLAEKVNAVSHTSMQVNEFNQRSGYRSDRLMVRYTSDWSAQDEADYQAALKVAAAPLKQKLTALTEAYQRLDDQTRQLEIYAKLEDYKRDQYQKAKAFPAAVDKELSLFVEAHQAIMADIEKAFGKPALTTKEAKAANEIRTFLVACRSLMLKWKFNRAYTVHTGWPVEDMRALYALHGQTWKNLKALPEIPGFFSQHAYLLESFEYHITSALNEYNDKARVSDEFSNSKLITFQRNLVTLVNDYNKLLNSFYQSGYIGLFMDFPILLTTERSEKVTLSSAVPPYADKPYRPFTFARQPTPIPKTVLASLDHYTEFLSECTRTVNQIIQATHRSNGTLARDAFEIKSGKRNMRLFNYLDVELPEASYRKAVNESATLPAAVRNSLMDQATVLYNIFNEMYEWNVRFKGQDAPKSVTFGSVDEVYQAFARMEKLTQEYEQHREQLHRDIQKILVAYTPPPGSSWSRTLQQAHQLVSACYSEVKQAREDLQAHQPPRFNPNRLDSLARQFLSAKYANLKGIPAVPGSGDDPGYRYENLFNQVHTLNLQFAGLGKRNDSDTLFYFNRDVVLAFGNLTYDEQKLAELSRLPFLRECVITGVYRVSPPVPPRKKEDEREPVAVVPSVTTPVPGPTQNPNTTEGRVIRDTVRITDIIRIETRTRDTVYIEKRDTVYVSKPNENVMSLAGYAPNNLVLLVDVSSSMDQPEKLPLLKMSVLTIANLMRPEDELSLVIFSDKATVALPPTSAREFRKIQAAIQRLKPEGKTNGNQGIAKAYEVCKQNWIKGGNNRIILATDGEFSVTPQTQALIKSSAEQEMFLSIFSFAKNSNSLDGLRRLAQAGKGNFETITYSNIDVKLMSEAQGKKN